ncbi:uncharacterized protein [Epargyreus clarus]|uniref:uncharacterized protein n=1 Tax=Epargyreus clarus TaxID=520877 RepID=UPI003C2E3592
MNLSNDQFEKLLSVIGGQRRGSFASCTAYFNGTRNSDVVETFLAAATTFKLVEHIDDEDALRSIPLILKEEAAVWWNGIKEQVTNWTDFQARIRHAFAPRRPAYQIYQDIVGVNQKEEELTEVFIAKKRALFAQLPEPSHSESQQIDMIYGQINLNIRERISRDSVQNFDALLNTARSIEQLLEEKQPQMTQSETQGRTKTVGKKQRCAYCRFPGHSIESCRKKQKAEENSVPGPSVSTRYTASGTQAPSPSQPKFSCYGCGTLGVVRSKCPTCSKTKSLPTATQGKQDISFCAVNTKTDARPRPVIGIGVGKIVGTAYIDSCAKTSVASYELFQCLKKLGFSFTQQEVGVTLADGASTRRTVLSVQVPVSLCSRVIPTTFIIFPESRESRTLLGVGFIQDAGMVLNIPQMNWYFVDEPEVLYDLLEEDANEISSAHVETTPFSSPTRRRVLEEIQPFEFISPLPASSPDQVIIHGDNTREAALPQPSACAAMDLRMPGCSREDLEPALPERGASDTVPYRLIPLEPSPKRPKTLFDGYSPSFMDYMYQDAQIIFQESEVTLSPHSKKLFPSEGSDDVDICSISVSDIISETLNESQRDQLIKILWDNQEAFGESQEPTDLAEHCIDTGDHNPISVPPYRLSPPRLKLLKEEIMKMLKENVIEPCNSPWSAPVVMVPKKDGSVRVCVDYRRLNAITVPDIYPIPRIDDLLHAAKPTPFMSTLDLRAGYWQVKIKKRRSEQDGVYNTIWSLSI